MDISIGTLRMLIEGYKIPYPLVMERVQALYDHFAPGRENKGFSLSKVPDRRRGFVFYVRYYDKGAMVPSRRSTGTNDHSPAGAFARQNRERLLAAYYKKRQVFSHLASRGYLAENPCGKVLPLSDTPETHKTRGCYDAGLLKGVFDEEWEDKTACLLCLLIHGTNLRNCDIRKILNSGKKKDISEVAKYTLRDSEFAAENDSLTDRLVGVYDKALRNLRLYAFGDVMKQIARMVRPPPPACSENPLTKPSPAMDSPVGAGE